MKEPLISFETAKLAKEVGFLEPSCTWYNFSGLLVSMVSISQPANGKFPSYSAPTQALLQKWLRDGHEIRLYVEDNYDRMLGYLRGWSPLVNGTVYYKDNDCFPTYEEALEAGLFEALTIIKNKKQ
jgi:hypothetical protein